MKFFLYVTIFIYLCVQGIPLFPEYVFGFDMGYFLVLLWLLGWTVSFVTPIVALSGIRQKKDVGLCLLAFFIDCFLLGFGSTYYYRCRF